MQHLYEAIEKTLNSLNHSYQNPKPLAKVILKASEYFIQRSGSSPWNDPDFCAAYIAHFLPMNVFRLRQGLLRLQQPQTLQLIQNTPLYDYGCGPLTFLISYILTFQHWPQAYQYFDLDSKAPKLGLQILKDLQKIRAQDPQVLHSNFKWQDLTEPTPLKQTSSSQLVILSYSLNELPEDLKLHFLNFKHLLIFEPSMRSTSRQLLEFRRLALSRGFLSLAPCFHSLACPMLTHSEKDWCFDRAHLDLPELALNLYKHLPFDQDQATFSYLFLSQEDRSSLDTTATADETAAAAIATTTTPQSVAQWARVVGDTMKEKGKSRTMICRGEPREFLAVLKKQKLDLKLHRGEAFPVPDNTEIKGNELRITSLPES